MNAVLMHPPKSTLGRARTPVVVVLLVVVVAVTFLGVSRLVRGPAFVDHVTIQNPTELLVDVSVATDDGRGALLLGAVEPHRSATVESVLDAGDTWVFELSVAGRDVDQLQLSREQLERTDWRITIPARAGVPGGGS